MDHRGRPWPDSGRHSRRTKDRDDKSRHSHQDRDQSYPAPDPRERERHWVHPDAGYRAHYPSPAARQEQYPYNSHQYPYSYERAEPQRPLSRHGYDYPPQGHYYRDNYGYYDHDYYRGQHGRQDGGQWGPQDSWRTDRIQESKYIQEHSGSSEEYRYDQGGDTSQHHLNVRGENPSTENEEVSSYYLGTLESSKTSGLSSSSYELSQYMNGGEHGHSAPQPAHTSDAEHGPVHQASAPLKYSIPHAIVSFGPAGQLIRVTAGFSAQKNVSQLEVHSLEVILSETQEQQEMRNFPGPLTREDLHKVDAIEFAQQEAGASMKDDRLQDKSSAALLWNLLILLCRQNGQIVGSDIAEMLMQGSRSDGSRESEATTLIDFSEGATAEEPPQKGDDLLTGNWSSFSSETTGKALQSYTRLLLAGRKKEALESAMSNGLWGHALFLASKMDNRSYTTVLNRFTGQLTASDPLQTLFQLLSGRIPAVATCCGNEQLADWRPHLAVMLSNETGDPAVQQKAIVTMGDTLASRGLLHAAHVCYLTAGVPFGVFTQKAERLVLLSSSHRQPFEYFATNSAIHCTELYEYCQTLRGKCFSIPSFQVYKFLYASRLLDCGLASQAFHYCEVVGKAVLGQREPVLVLTGEVVKLADRLRHSEGQFSDAGVGGDGQQPDWLKQLRARHQSFQTGSYGSAETYHPEPEVCALAHEDSKVNSAPGLADLSRDIHSPEPELLYYRVSEDQDVLLNQTQGNPEERTALSSDIAGAQAWPCASPPIPVTVVYAPLVPTVATSQGLSYHNRDSAEVRTASTHCPLSVPPSAAEGAGSYSGTGEMGGRMLEVDIRHQGQNQQGTPQGFECSGQTDEPPKESTKTGWFRGWFNSKPKDDERESSEHRSTAQTELPPSTGFCPPPPPAIISPDTFPPQPSSAGINPFSRKAGQRLG
ncbi:protein transport protein Sec16B isoform X2 [Scophthalmus maximus]|uniref:protein transport protein Sec16B isoform X2 n=1 Tax=Scophthalmus maximus TaxID=52904 RepID=UPI001FA86F46|nr:protein transport protein Sec16B isoform X2 [Scophthalmus maximus]XP_047192642.1 protein transport protein Sec16B isoform X2 [Scophthalmus maximus]XP_047192643.1 protein transport protein Sec16B isoform X2 [Scophthalmus maximus]